MKLLLKNHHSVITQSLCGRNVLDDDTCKGRSVLETSLLRLLFLKPLYRSKVIRAAWSHNQTESVTLCDGYDSGDRENLGVFLAQSDVRGFQFWGCSYGVVEMVIHKVCRKSRVLRPSDSFTKYTEQLCVGH